MFHQYYTIVDTMHKKIEPKNSLLKICTLHTLIRSTRKGSDFVDPSWYQQEPWGCRYGVKPKWLYIWHGHGIWSEGRKLLSVWEVSFRRDYRELFRVTWEWVLDCANWVAKSVMRGFHSRNSQTSLIRPLLNIWCVGGKGFSHLGNFGVGTGNGEVVLCNGDYFLEISRVY